MLIADQVVDLIWAARLPGGFRSVAGIGVALTITQVGQMGRSGLDQSTRAMISRSAGAKNLDFANEVLNQSFVLNSMYSLLMIVSGILLTDILLRLIGTGSELSAQAGAYMRIQFVTAAMIGFRQIGNSALQATGDVMTPLRGTTVARVAHIILSPFLIFGWGFLPSLGVAGASLANCLGQVGACVIIYSSLLRGTSTLRLNLKRFRFNTKIVTQLVKIGAPASLIGMERSVTQLILLRMVTPFGDVPTAAFSVTKRLENFLNFGSMGVGQATGVMVGQSLGAGDVNRARKVIWWGVLFGNIVPAAVRIFMIITPTTLVVLFSSRPDVIEETTAWLQIQVYASMALGTAMVFQQSYNTAGDTLFPLLLTGFTEWFIEIPTAFFLSQTSVGAIAIPFAALAGGMARAAGYSAYFFTGRWYKVKVLPHESPGGRRGSDKAVAVK